MNALRAAGNLISLALGIACTVWWIWCAANYEPDPEDDKIEWP